MDDVECDIHAEAGHIQIIFHDDDETPVEFVIELQHSVFNKQIADATRRLREAMNCLTAAASSAAHFRPGTGFC
jgi:hypothetical protein